jgi:hypothetical protein
VTKQQPLNERPESLNPTILDGDLQYLRQQSPISPFPLTTSSHNPAPWPLPSLHPFSLTLNNPHPPSDTAALPLSARVRQIIEDRPVAQRAGGTGIQHADGRLGRGALVVAGDSCRACREDVVCFEVSQCRAQIRGWERRTEFTGEDGPMTRDVRENCGDEWCELHGLRELVFDTGNDP